MKILRHAQTLLNVRIMRQILSRNSNSSDESEVELTYIRNEVNYKNNDKLRDINIIIYLKVPDS